MFKQTKKYIILGAKLYLREGNKEESETIMADRKRRRVESQPLEFPNAGSVFRNPEGDYAGRLIEECELKGYRLGGAEVSTKHANFIVNKENATGKDVHDLILYVHDTVKEKTGVEIKGITAINPLTNKEIPYREINKSMESISNDVYILGKTKFIKRMSW